MTEGQSHKRYRRSVEDDEEDEMTKFMRMAEEEDAAIGEDGVFVPLKQRKNNRRAQADTSRHQGYSDAVSSGGEESSLSVPTLSVTQGAGSVVAPKKSLVDEAAQLRMQASLSDSTKLKQMRQKMEEEALLKEANQVQTNVLQSNEEIAQGMKYTESLTTTWRPPKYIQDQSEDINNSIRKKWNIIVEGDGCPPPIKTFKEMKLPQCVLDALVKKGINRPTPIQVQALPAILSGRDIIGVAFTGSGKTLTFALPLIMFSLEEEMNMPIEGGEGPVGIILAPSRELARQTFEIIEYFIKALEEGGFPQLRAVLCIGGEDKRTQVEPVKMRGVHMIVATPGRLNDLLNQGKIKMGICKYIVLDEGDRMLDLGFDEEVHNIVNKFKRQRQTILFSATMPQKFQEFARNTLVQPLIVNVGRAGAANLDVIQEVEYVKREAKVIYLLECLQKTPPPVIIFCERKGDVDEIHEYLLIKGVSTASIHGGKDQEERNEAIRLYKAGEKDVLVATDVASKGLDFPDIQHVINFDMPSQIEDYIHRIGRTGRCGKTGVATTFINKDVEETTLLDLKHLLIEAKQRVPPVLQALDDPDEALDDEDGEKKRCPFCDGRGHRITNCPKLDKDARRIGSGKKDAITGGEW
jgi:ATP-dependent RNA helicase DDX41